MNLLAADSAPMPGACYRFVVDSADQAATLIRERLGENARVLSVRSVASSGWRRLVSAPKLEVIAQIEAPVEASAPAPAPVAATVEITSTSAISSVSSARRIQPENFRSLPELLTRSGFSENVVNRLQATPAWTSLSSAPLHRSLVEVGRQLCSQVESRPARAPLSRAAFLGAPGVGRSTALCKWLAAEVFRRARLGHVITAEFDRPHTPGPLPVFCEALGVPLAHYPASTQPSIPGGFVYFDLPGLSLRNPEENAGIANFLKQEEITERVLVLNAAYEHAALRRAFAVGRDLAATHVIFTHLDETPQWGRLWDYLLESELEPLFLSTGPSLTSDYEPAAAQALARRTLPISD
jgi:flagellar biosynthesis protein FlhF